MTIRKPVPDRLDDIETPHALAAEPAGGAGMEAPLTVRLGALWSDLLRDANERAEASSASRSPSAVPLLDDMKGILQWD
jgi:hypothetical protein